MAAKIGVTRKPRCASAPNGRAATPPRPVLRPRYDDSTSQPPEEQQMRGRQPAAGEAKEGLMARGGEQRQRKGRERERGETEMARESVMRHGP
jgi:hypothetical protein